MGRILEFINRVMSKGRPAAGFSGDVEELRAAFRRRYEAFRILLTSNSKALEIMTDMEIALQGTRSFGMSFVRSRCTSISVNVYKIIKYLNELAPAKYEELFERFKLIEEKINRLLTETQPILNGALTLPLEAVDNSTVDLTGGKMANLGVVRNQLGLRVPGGFVITSSAYERFMEHNDLRGEIRRRMQAMGPESLDTLQKLSVELQQVVLAWPLPEEVESAILDSYARLEREVGPETRVSVRSSALGEDIAGRAFAGQFRSELNVSSESLIQAYKQVVASKYGLTAMSYRFSRGIPDESIAMCAGVMVMIRSASGGVMYSSNPMNPRAPHVIIHSVWGLPKGVVDGSVPADVFLVEKGDSPEIRDRDIKPKRRSFICYPEEGVRRVEAGDDTAMPQSLTDTQVVELARIAVHLEQSFGTPQDIEWCVASDGSIFILQCRPLHLWYSAAGGEPVPQSESENWKLLADGETTAAGGVGSGPVFVLQNEADKLRFPEGAVMVVSNALPAWAPLLGRASALVAEEGSMAGHLANVAREFRVPALFGVPDATERLTEGVVITVDAFTRNIYEGRIEPLLRAGIAQKNLMQGSPILGVLERVAAHIIPLNLLDPDSHDFRPQKCSTYHDITRFAHEVSVREMFHFGEEHHFSERSAKRLVVGIPMQYWVINLEDGFTEPVEDASVKLHQIACIPMLALWQGFTAIPWEGPPSMDPGGFMSVLMQSVTNPALDPAVSSPFTARNYFIISRTFCNLMSRFGYHFSTVEALVGERSIENYVGFSFKGGAADLPRRIRRAQLVSGILREIGFRVNLKEDSLIARLDNRDEEYMKSRLIILGYLIMHTRQIDMVMQSDDSFLRYKTKFNKDIQFLLNRQ